MAIDLERVVYNKLEDGSYEISVASWDMKQTSSSEDYIVLNCTIPALNNRPVKINLFEKGLNIVASNVSAHLDLPEVSLLEVLDSMVGKELPAYHQTVVQDGKTYYNWYICSTPRVVDPDEVTF